MLMLQQRTPGFLRINALCTLSSIKPVQKIRDFWHWNLAQERRNTMSMNKEIPYKIYLKKVKCQSSGIMSGRYEK